MMKEREYIDELYCLMDKLNEGEIESVEERLKELYHYKPVRLLWHVIYANVCLAKGNPVKGWEEASPYCWPGLHNLGTEEFIRFHRAIEEYWGFYEELRHLNYVYGNEREKAVEVERLHMAMENYMQKRTVECLAEVMQGYLNVEQMVIFYIVRMKLVQEGYICNDDKNAWYYQKKNYNYLEEKVLYSKDSFLLVENDDNAAECNLLAMLLHEFGHPVYILTQPVNIENASVHSDAVLQICLENIQVFEEYTAIPVCERILPNGSQDNNQGELINYLYENEWERNFGIIIAKGDTLFALTKNNIVQKNIECLSEVDHVGFSDRMYFGWVGNYLEYISDIYGFDVKEKLKEKPEYDFSIVIPARNAAGTLYYTLQTCLTQDYDGTWEIVVSDNSTEGNSEVYQVCRDLKDSHIKYVKTPRNLALSKSFEFAFLQAKGEFVFAIGADDGVCPWALSILSNVLKYHPDEEIIQWIRGFYGWNGFDGIEENELIIPGVFKEGDISLHYEKRLDYFARILKYPEFAYLLPNLYINSGYRKKYLLTLFEKTGRLWDGCNQDLYMGVMSAAIHEQILNIDFPLTVAGMSNNSMGYAVGKPDNKEEDLRFREIKKSSVMGDNAGLHVVCGIAKDIPVGSGHNYSMYVNIMRAIQLGVLPVEWIGTVLNEKIIFLRIISEYDKRDDFFDKNIHYARYLAERKGKDFLHWFDQTIYGLVMQPKYYERANEKSFKKQKEGAMEDGGLRIDASKYGVTNIAEAMESFSRFIYWTPDSWQEELEKRF